MELTLTATQTGTGSCDPVTEDSSLTDLVLDAREGSSEAWTALFERFDGLIRSIARRYRVSASDVDDVSQSVWLKVLEHLDTLTEPKALPGWIATTTSRHCLREVALNKRVVRVDPTTVDEASLVLSQGQLSPPPPVEEAMVRQEDRQAVRESLAVLSPRHRDLMLLAVAADPPLPYRQISTLLGMPVGSIGPTRARCLLKLREADALQSLYAAGPEQLATAG